MTLLDALKLARDQKARVRPVCWRTTNPKHWVERRDVAVTDQPFLFVECGLWEEIPHALRLQTEAEMLGDWEEMP